MILYFSRLNGDHDFNKNLSDDTKKRDSMPEEIPKKIRFRLVFSHEWV